MTNGIRCISFSFVFITILSWGAKQCDADSDCPPGITGARLLEKINKNGAMAVHYTEKEDSRLILECEPCGNPKPNIKWIVNGIEKLNHGKRYDVRDLKLSDAGNYSCIIENAEGKDNHTFRVEVKQRELYIKKRPPKTTAVELGGSYNFECEPNREDVLIKWYKDIDLEKTDPYSYFDDKIIDSKNDASTWKLSNISREDLGWYSCLIVLPQNDQEGTNASFRLTEKMDLRFKSVPSKNIMVELGGSHNFKCETDRNDVLTTWYKGVDLEKINPDSKLDDYKIKLKDDKMPTFELSNIVQRDEGMYSCLVVLQSDDQQRINASFHLTVSEFKTFPFVVPMVIIILFAVIALMVVIFNSYKLKRKEEKLEMALDKVTVLTQVIIKKIIIENDNENKDSMTIPQIRIESSYDDSHTIRKDSFSTVVYELPPDEYEVPLNQLKLGKRIGHGEFGEVFLAEANGIVQKGVTTVVAVKMLKDDHKESDVKALVTEMEIMKIIGKHDNIINLLGCCHEKGKLRVITEYAANGNLRDYLRSYNSTNSSNSNYAKSKPGEDQLLNYALQVTRGMEYLASKKCIHRDLAARNILVTSDYTMKIADFGLARNVEDTEYYRNMISECQLPLKWMAPESIFHKKFTTQSDVWSFGVLLWEIMSMGGVPYATVTMNNFLNYLREGNRLEKPPDCSAEVYQIMCHCWNSEPEKRPNFSEIVKLLSDLLTSGEKQMYPRVPVARFSWALTEYSSDEEDESNNLLFPEDTFQSMFNEKVHPWMLEHKFININNEISCK